MCINTSEIEIARLRWDAPWFCKVRPPKECPPRRSREVSVVEVQDEVDNQLGMVAVHALRLKIRSRMVGF